MPFPLQAVLLSQDHVDVSLQDLQQELTQCEVHPWLAEQLHRLLALPFDCILTPNFTYEVECALFPDFLNHPQRFLRHTAAVPRAEKYFMLHTYYSLPLAGETSPLPRPWGGQGAQHRDPGPLLLRQPPLLFATSTSPTGPRSSATPCGPATRSWRPSAGWTISS